MLIGGAVVVMSFLLGFADRSERALGQALIATVPAVILASGLVLIYFFDHAYEGLSGSIRPVAMERALERMTAIQHATGVPPAPCPST
jgi:ABC-type Mn2+/Zn2+ transport system permease subunit